MSEATNGKIDNILYELVCSKFKLGLNPEIIKTDLRKMNINDQVIDFHISHYFEEFKKKHSEDIVRENQQREDWYGGANETPNSHWSKLKEILQGKDGWSDEMIQDLNASSDSIVAETTNPNLLSNGINYHTKGLVLGYVQSGKTANYSAVITKALDAGYKFIIVLAGIHNNLRYQTEVRLREEIIEPSELSSDTLTRSDKNGDFSKKETTSANKACGKKHGFTIAVLKKNASVLRNFNKWLSEADEKYRDSCPVLIIDDESDQASINTSKEPELDATAINNSIRDILNQFKIVSYIGYTATPFANVLIDATIDNDLFPKDFIISLKKPATYTGAQELFGGLDAEGRIVGGLPLIRSIPIYDAVLMAPAKRKEVKNYDQMPESLEKAIDSFLISTAIRIARKQYKKHMTMLVHSSYKIDDQKKVHKLVDEYVWNSKYLYQQDNQEMKERILALFEEDFAKTSKDMNVKEDANFDFDVIWKNIGTFLDFMQVILDNSESENRLSYEDKFWGIVVGGNTLSRGLTLEGLTVSYFIRSSKMYDTLMQMGRWFGYRPGYLDVKRIFITDEIRDNFFDMATVENEIREEIKVMSENKDRPIDVRIRVRKHPGMLITASNKSRTAAAVEFTFSGRRALPDFLNLQDKKILSRNESAVETLLSRIREQGIIKENDMFNMFRKSLLYRDVPRETIMQFVDDIEISKANTRAQKKFLSTYIEKQIRLTNWSVAVMSRNKGGDIYKFKTGDETLLLDRSIAVGVKKENDLEADYIRGLFLPRDEMIDMKDMFEKDKEVNDILIKDGKSIGCASLRRNIRPKDRGLLVIYPLSPNSNTEERTTGNYTLAPLKAKSTAFGFMFVFPEDEKDFIGDFIVNATV